MNIKSANDLVNEALLEIKTISAEEVKAVENEYKVSCLLSARLI